MRSNHNRMRRRLLEAGASVAALGPGISVAADLDALSAREQTVSIQLVRNATVKIRVGGRTLLIDPYLSPKNEGYSYAGRERSPLVELPIPAVELLAGIDAVFVSHLHSDHFDEAARRALPRSTPMLCPAALAPRLRQFGFDNVMPIADGIDWLGMRLDITDGRHGPDSVLADMGTVNGLVVRAAGMLPLYWVGDSIWCPPVRDVIDRFAPGTIVVHACGATWEGKGPLVMDAGQVEAILRYSATATVIATHMDCVDHATVSRVDLRKYFASRRSLAARLQIPDDGAVLGVAT
jgi:L-ascorbate metabolism protein UlaG (beta-lactamase superfamily)